MSCFLLVVEQSCVWGPRWRWQDFHRHDKAHVRMECTCSMVHWWITFITMINFSNTREHSRCRRIDGLFPPLSVLGTSLLDQTVCSSVQYIWTCCALAHRPKNGLLYRCANWTECKFNFTISSNIWNNMPARPSKYWISDIVRTTPLVTAGGLFRTTGMNTRETNFIKAFPMNTTVWLSPLLTRLIRGDCSTHGIFLKIIVLNSFETRRMSMFLILYGSPLQSRKVVIASRILASSS